MGEMATRQGLGNTQMTGLQDQNGEPPACDLSRAGGSCRQEVGGVRPEGEALKKVSPEAVGRSAASGGRDAAS
jgi:hypothetical protein